MSNEQMKKCIDNCLKCYAICTQTKVYCITKGEEHADPEHLNIMTDCAELCKLSADFMLRESIHHEDICKMCAVICVLCAEDCEKMDDKIMKECAKICRDCSESCREMGGI